MSAAWMSAFVNGAIISAVLAAALSAVFHLSAGRYWNASTRYATWLAALVVAIAIPLIWMPLRPFSRFEPISTPASKPAGSFTTGVPPTSEVIDRNQGTEAATKPAPIRSSAVRRFFPLYITAGVWAQRIVSAWMIVSLLMLLRLLVSYVMLHSRKQSAYADPKLGDDLAGKWLKRCGSARRVRLAASSEIAGPVAAGPIRPHILIPTRLLEELQADELEQVGLHEAAHFARHDDWALIFQRICEAVLVFHPIVRRITWQMDIEREVACDDFVVEITGAAHRYAECLTRVIEVTNGIPALPLAAPATTTRSVLERRLDMLLNKDRNSRTRVLKIRFAGLLMALGAITWLAGSEPQLIAFAGPQTTGNPLKVQMSRQQRTRPPQRPSVARSIVSRHHRSRASRP